ncbi:MAG: SUMF1/EgtB/PvdO family nonheme iron enzyme [Cyanobacteria bacterium J06648_16]
MSLSGALSLQLRRVLTQAFPTYRSLESLLRQNSDVRVNEVVRSGSSYQESISQLIEFLDSRGQLNDFIQIAARSNPGNEMLQQLLEQLLSSSEVSKASLSLRRTPRTAQGYIEPLLAVTGALPLHMALIPSGTFLMGSPDTEPERQPREGPQHPVTVPAFFMGRYPITQAQWRTVAQLDQVAQSLNPNPSNFKGDNHPVESVSWHDATEFCARLSKHTGRPYRLPSEAEWEYACRAGTTTPFYFGPTLTDEIANYQATKTYGNGPAGEYRRQTTPVNHFDIANAFGLSDMHGNVLEWCQDHLHDSYEGTPDNGSAWEDRDDSLQRRILRGGSWSNYPRYCRSAYRYNDYPVNRDSFIGFRVVSSAPRILQ